MCQKLCVVMLRLGMDMLESSILMLKDSGHKTLHFPAQALHQSGVHHLENKRLESRDREREKSAIAGVPSTRIRRRLVCQL